MAFLEAYRVDYTALNTPSEDQVLSIGVCSFFRSFCKSKSEMLWTLVEFFVKSSLTIHTNQHVDIWYVDT